MSIPRMLEIEDKHIGKVMNYRLIEMTKNKLLVYENVKTKCKQCFSIQDFKHIKGGKARIITNSCHKEEWSE